MTVDEVLAKAFQQAKGKPVPPETGSTKYNSLVILCDSFQKVWAAEPGVEWDSLYSVVDIGVVTATNTFELDDTIDYIVKRSTDPVYLSDGTNRADYTVVRPNQLYVDRDGMVVAQAGINLLFPSAFASDSQYIGYTINVPAILKPEDLTAGADDVQVDDPMWLVHMVAANFIATDLARRDDYSRHIADAQVIMEKMKQRNSGQNETVNVSTWSPLGGENL
jgi:hypothetical protein